MAKQNLFTEDFCDECYRRVNVNTLVENNEHWICQDCEAELQEQAERQQEGWDD